MAGITLPRLQGQPYAGSGPQPYASSPGPGGNMYGGEWEQPVTNPVSQIIQQIQAQGLPPTAENVNRVRQQAPQRLPTPPIPPQPGPDRTVEGYQPHFSDPDTSSRPPTPAPRMPMPPNEGGTPRPPDGSGDPVTQSNPIAPSPQAVGLSEPGGPPDPGMIGRIGQLILQRLPIQEIGRFLTTPNASLNRTMMVPGASEMTPEPPIVQQPQIAGPPKQLALPAPAKQPALPAPAPQGQPALPAPNTLPQGPGFEPEYPRSPAKVAIDKAVPDDEPVAPRAKRKARVRR